MSRTYLLITFRCAIILYGMLAASALGAQARYDFPWWDYRSPSWLNGRVGVGMQFSNQNRQLYFFTETDICFSCAYNYFARPPENLQGQLRRNKFRGNLHLKLQTSKDFSLYGTRFSKNSEDIQFRNLSWTYLTNVGISADWGLYRTWRVADTETGDLLPKFRKRSRIRLRYDFTSRYHSYYYRKLSNTVGYVTVNVARLDDRWGFNINWGNDVFIPKFMRSFLTNHDHGETNSALISAYFRPLETRARNANEVFAYKPESLQKLEASVSLRMITDRRTHKRLGSNQIRMGMYDVLGLANSFHGYYGVRLKAETGFGGLGVFLGKDDLKWGRDMQRFAHQGYSHLPGSIVRKIFLKMGGVSTPLFPWESQPLYNQKPRFYYEINTDLFYPYVSRPYQQ
ncbi:MAG: hypothetical protein JNM22_11395 [Saprospiraceae bacterium]|nr:hypothetical protein [Saprospiraceae bacterium]